MALYRRRSLIPVLNYPCSGIQADQADTKCGCSLWEMEKESDKSLIDPESTLLVKGNHITTPKFKEEYNPST